MNINPVTANVKSYACNNFSKQAERTCSSNPIQQTAQESSTQKLNINNVQSKFNISFRGEVNPDSKQTQSQKLFGLLRQMDRDKVNKTVDDIKKKEIDSCRSELERCRHYGKQLECKEMSSSHMKHISKIIPKEFEETVLWQDKYGNSGFHKYFDYEGLSKIAQAQPQVFDKALLLQNKKGETPVHVMSYNYTSSDGKKMELMADTAPDSFEKALTMQDKNGNTPLHIAAAGTYPEVTDKIMIMAQKAPEKFKEAMLIKNNKGDTPVKIAIFNHKDNNEKIKLMSEYAPEELGLSLLIKDKSKNNLLHQNPDFNKLNIIQKTAPKEFDEALQAQNNEAKTPIHYFKSYYYNDQLAMIAKRTPKALGKTMIIQDEEGKTPLHYMKGRLVETAAQASPVKFREAMLLKDNNGRTPLYYYTKNEDIDAILSVAQNAPDEFYIAANDIYDNSKNIFEKITESCLKDKTILKTLSN